MSGHHLSFEVIGHPEPAGSKKAVPPRGGARFAQVIDANPKAAPWKKLVAATARGSVLKHRFDVIDGPVWVSMVFHVRRPGSHFRTDGVTLSAEGQRKPYPTSKPDVLKLARAVEDALTGIVYVDDAAIVSESLRKEYTVGPEGVVVTVMPL